MSHTLKPCPFCGNPARWATTTEEEDWEIQCSNPECPVIFIGGGDHTGEELKRLWNHRERILSRRNHVGRDTQAEAGHKTQASRRRGDVPHERERVAAERLGMFHNCDWPDAVADEVTALREQVERLSELEARIQTLVGTECQRCERGDELFIEPSTRFYTHTLGGNYCSAHTLHSLLNTKASIAARAKGDHAKEEPHGTNHE